MFSYQATLRQIAVAAAISMSFFHADFTFAQEVVGNNSLEARVKELEATVRQLEQSRPTVIPTTELTFPASATESSKPNPASTTDAPKAKTPVLSGWDNGFILRSPDDDFKLRITGQIQSDYRDYGNHYDAVDTPTFLVRRARLGIDATVLKYYEFRLLPEFGQGNPRIVDSYFNIHYWDEVQFEVGKFKQAFSFEQLIQDRFVPTVERSLIDQLGPARDVGAMIHGQKLFDDRLDYAMTVYGGVRDGDQDTDRNKEVSGRLAIRPFKQLDAGGWIEGFQFGLAGTVGRDTGLIGTNVYRTPANVPWFKYADGVRPGGTRWRYSPELVYLNGPFSATAQYHQEARDLRTPVDSDGKSKLTTVKADGFYVMLTMLVTGEERTSMSQTIDPLRPFNPRDGSYGPGAWELVSRVSHLEFGDDQNPSAFAKLLNKSGTTRAATEVTTGFNWYLNKFVRLQFNWEYARFGNPIRLGTPGRAGLLDHQNSFVTRFQIVF